MPRRRMIDPDFWTDSKLAKASRDERLLFIGLFSNADDDGRIMANPAYLKSIIFPYDDDISSTRIKEMRDHLAQINPNIILYENAGDEYIQLKRWERHQKPRYPKPSKFPPPSGFNQKDVSLPHPCNQKDESLPPRSGQSSQGKVSLGQVSVVKEDFMKFLDNERDLTDFLMTTLTKNISAGRAQALVAEGGLGGGGQGELSPETEATVKMNWGIQVLRKCWKDGIGEDMPNSIFDGARKALKQYPLEVVAKAFAKGVRYKGGKHKSWKYIQAIIDEQMEKRHGRGLP